MDLEQRLATLADREVRGDWLDVMRRARQQRAVSVRRAILVAAVLVLLAIPTFALAVRLVDDWLVVEEKEELPSSGSIPLPYFFGDRLQTPAGVSRLAQPVLAPLLGEDAALAVPSPDKRSVAYHAWDEAPGGREAGGVPLIRLHELSSGKDVVLESGSQSLAWRADGAFAFMRALRPRYENSPQGTLGGQLGHVVVRYPLEAPARRWTTMATRYTVRAWAGRILLAAIHPSYVYSGPQPERGLHALDGPGRMRRLPLDDLTALNAAGTLAVGAPGVSGDGPPPPFVNIVHVADGRVVARMPLPGDLFTVGGLGSWVGDWIVIPATARRGVGALLFLRYSKGRLSIEHLIRLDRTAALSAGVKGFRGIDYARPMFADATARTVVFRANVFGPGDPYVTMFLTCDRGSRVCRRGVTLEPPTRWAALVSNPSRPLPD